MAAEMAQATVNWREQASVSLWEAAWAAWSEKGSAKASV
jgi:hypothetical protein